ncbi:septin-2 isoform X1 [Octopus sinensis]|uniref:Septin n=1 Tax=Octopus sinensis TaxID=2607531 RepID=A0A7E6FPR4_9MOLL|nr:septin-2 isoform X1 [Octopus sinensis]
MNHIYAGLEVEVNRSISSSFSSLVSSPPRTVLRFVNPEQIGYVGFANLPNQVHRKSVKKGFEFTLLVVGESGLGKSTLVNSLFLADLYPERHIPSASEKITQTVKIDASTVEIEERGVKLRLTVVDTPGFGDSLNSEDCFTPIIEYIDEQFERYLHDESGLNRRHIIDNRVHCCFYFINPSSHGLKPLDISFMKAVHHKVNIVPVLAKADTLTKKEVLNLKRKIMDQIDEYGINIYPLPDCDSDEDDDYKEQCRQLKEAVPFAVVGSSESFEVNGKKVRGRRYPWGVVEVENPDHCDFIKLRTMLITHMQDLQEVTQEIHYENFRAEKLAGGKVVKQRTSRSGVQQPEATDREQALMEKEAELRQMKEMLAKMQAEMAAQKTGNSPVSNHQPRQNGEVKSQNV